MTNTARIMVFAMKRLCVLSLLAVNAAAQNEVPIKCHTDCSCTVNPPPAGSTCNYLDDVSVTSFAQPAASDFVNGTSPSGCITYSCSGECMLLTLQVLHPVPQKHIREDCRS